MMKKRGLFLILSLLFCMGVFSACVTHVPPPSPPVDDSTIHMYLIAGQSNAVGISPIATAVDEDMTKTFDNVLYAGETDYVIATETPSSSFGLKEERGSVPSTSFASEFVSVKAGYGRTSNHFGPEYGMADFINSTYSGERKAMFFKSAAGGTCVRNVYAGDYNASLYGNWYARSLKDELPEIEVNAGTSVQYDRFVTNFEIAYQKLVDDNHKVRIMGLVWMQGESDRATPQIIEDYPRLLNALLTDLREDISEITGSDYSRLPVIAGEISETHGISRGSNEAAFNTEVAKNRAFNEMLNGIEADGTISDFYVITAHDMVQNVLVDGVTQSLNTYDTGDPWHWIADYMVELGHRFADKLVYVANK